MLIEGRSQAFTVQIGCLIGEAVSLSPTNAICPRQTSNVTSWPNERAQPPTLVTITSQIQIRQIRSYHRNMLYQFYINFIFRRVITSVPFFTTPLNRRTPYGSCSIVFAKSYIDQYNGLFRQYHEFLMSNQCFTNILRDWPVYIY